MARTVLELKCIKCGTKFEKSFEKKRGDPEYPEGEMLRLEDATCPNKCGGEWFAVEKQHPIRKFKRRYGAPLYSCSLLAASCDPRRTL